MANTFFQAPNQNYLSKTLSGGISDSVNTITLNNTTGLPTPGYVVIDRQNTAGTSTPDAREVIYYTGISGSDLTGCVRAADNSTARTHNDGAVVETMLTVGMWNSLSTIVAMGLTGDGYLRAVASPVSIARGEFTQIVTPSIASIARGELSLLNVSSMASIAQVQATKAFLSALTISTSVNASGASIVGFPGGPSISDEDTSGGSSTTSSTYANITGADVAVTTTVTSNILLIASIQAFGNVDLAPYTIQWHDGTANIGGSSRIYLRSSNPRTTVMVHTIVPNKAPGTYTYTVQHKSEDNSSSLTAETVNCTAIAIPA